MAGQYTYLLCAAGARASPAECRGSSRPDAPRIAACGQPLTPRDTVTAFVLVTQSQPTRGGMHAGEGCCTIPISSLPPAPWARLQHCCTVHMRHVTFVDNFHLQLTDPHVWLIMEDCTAEGAFGLTVAGAEDVAAQPPPPPADFPDRVTCRRVNFGQCAGIDIAHGARCTLQDCCIMLNAGATIQVRRAPSNPPRTPQQAAAVAPLHSIARIGPCAGTRLACSTAVRHPHE